MKRLTTRCDGRPALAQGLKERFTESSLFFMLLNSLAAYEDAMPLERVQELAQAEKDGRLVVLPVKIGDKIYSLFDGEIQNLLVSNVIYRAIGGDACRIIVECIPFHRCYWREDFGKTVFLTREEAEAALKKREEAAQ